MSTDSSHERTGLCSFVFKDGRQCRLPVHTQGADHCLPHTLKHRRLARAEELGQLITEPFGAEFLGASDLNSALCRLFSAIAQGLMSPKTAKPLVDLSRTMLKAIPLARQEYISVYGQDELRKTIGDSLDRHAEPGPPCDNPEAISTDDPEPSFNAIDTAESLSGPALLTPSK